MRAWLYRINRHFDDLPADRRLVVFLTMAFGLGLLDALVTLLQIMPFNGLIWIGAMFILGIPRMIYIGGWLN